MRWHHITHRSLLALVLFGSLFALSGCTTSPLKEAQSINEQAYALYGTFVVFEEQAASIIKQSATPVEVKSVIRKADAAAKPVADALLASVLEYLKIKGELDAGTTTNDKLVLATANLERWIADATPVIQSLVKAVGGK